MKEFITRKFLNSAWGSGRRFWEKILLYLGPLQAEERGRVFQAKGTA